MSVSVSELQNEPMSGPRSGWKMISGAEMSGRHVVKKYTNAGVKGMQKTVGG